MNVAVFGGSFNPPHVGHVLAAAYVLATAEVERLVVVPAFKHPFGKALMAFEHRVRMCELACAALRAVDVSPVEHATDGLTLHTLEALVAEHPEWSLRLVIGADILGEVDKWYRFDAVRARAPLIVLGRHGSTPKPLLPPVSSTEVRALLAARRWDEVAPLVPRAVLSYIREHGLYEDA